MCRMHLFDYFLIVSQGFDWPSGKSPFLHQPPPHPLPPPLYFIIICFQDMPAEVYSECSQKSTLELFVKIISNFQPLTIFDKTPSQIFNGVLNYPLGYYVWELVFGKFNLFFQKFIHTWQMFIVLCYIYIGCRATKLKKEID